MLLKTIFFIFNLHVKCVKLTLFIIVFALLKLPLDLLILNNYARFEAGIYFICAVEIQEFC